MSASPRLEKLAAIDAVLDRAVSARHLPGVVAAVCDRSGVMYEAARGVMAAGADAPLRTDSVFRIASMTKPITALAVLMLAEEGKVALDQPLARYLPGYSQPHVLASFDETTGAYTVRPPRRAVTIRDLLTHSSGYGYWFLDREILIEAKGLVRHFDAPFLMHDPGERFSYGISTDVLGQIVEPLAGLPLERFVAERIFGPLGMTDTSYEPPADPARLVGIHVRRKNGVEPLGNETRGEPPRGGGGLYSTARDYMAFVRLLLNGGVTDRGERLVAAASVAAMTANQIGERFARMPRTVYPDRTLDFAFLDGTQKFGFSLAIETRQRPGRRSAGSWSWAGILNTYFWGDPQVGIGAVLLMQRRPFCDPECLAVLDDFEETVYSSSSFAASAPTAAPTPAAAR